jgi:hypothetical protein
MIGYLLYAKDGGSKLVAMRQLNRVIAQVLEKAAVSEGQLSEEAGYHEKSFARFKIGVRNATPAAARALADALRQRADLLMKLADRLDRAANKEEG